MTMKANEKIRPLNDRMPVLLKPDEYERWLHGSIEDVIAFQYREPPPSEKFEVLRTRDRWQSGTPPSKASRRRDDVLKTGKMTRTWFSVREEPIFAWRASGASAMSGGRSIPAS
jgi:hypothetical protein